MRAKPLPRRLIRGIELVGDDSTFLLNLTQQQLKAFARDITANVFTFARYRISSQVRVWEALALHYCLDPGKIALDQGNRLVELRQLEFALRPYLRRMSLYLDHLESVRVDISRGDLPCHLSEVDLLQSVTTLEQFVPYTMDKGWHGYPNEVWMQQVGLDEPHPFLPDLLEGAVLWTAFLAGEGARPDLRQFYQDKVGFPQFSGHIQ